MFLWGKFERKCNLHYTNDLLILTMGGLEDLRIMKLILYVFEGLTSLETNFSKTCLFSSTVGNIPGVKVATTLNCSVGLLLMTYLGILISGRRPRRQDWESLIEKVRKLGIKNN